VKKQAHISVFAILYYFEMRDNGLIGALFIKKLKTNGKNKFF